MIVNVNSTNPIDFSTYEHAFKNSINYITEFFQQCVGNSTNDSKDMHKIIYATPCQKIVPVIVVVGLGAICYYRFIKINSNIKKKDIENPCTSGS